VVLDKTGTLTRGRPELTDVVIRDGIREEGLLRLVASAERDSEHPLGEAIVRGAGNRGLPLAEADEFEAVSAAASASASRAARSSRAATDSSPRRASPIRARNSREKARPLYSSP